MADIAAVILDLKTLRQGIGVQDPKIFVKTGLALRQACGVAASDSPGMAGKKIYTRLEHVVEQLPEAQRDLARAVLGYDATAEGSYTSRLETFGGVRKRQIRTMQRRADDVVKRIAELLCDDDTQQAVRRASPWSTACLRSIVVVDWPAIEALEERQIISHRRSLAEIEHSMTVLPVDQLSGPLDLAAFGIEVLSGVDVNSVHRAATNRIALRLRLPRALEVDDAHEFMLRVRLPSVSPFYVCTPAHPCARFELRARFRGVRPTRIWRIEGEFATDAADPLPVRPTLDVDTVGDVRAVFEHLEPARSYGIGWQPGPDPEPSHG